MIEKKGNNININIDRNVFSDNNSGMFFEGGGLKIRLGSDAPPIVYEASSGDSLFQIFSNQGSGLV